MAGPQFRIRTTQRFEADVRHIPQSHYPQGKKGRKPKREFRELLFKIVQQLALDPTLHDVEPWPGGRPRSSWELRKVRFWMPRLRASAAAGRLIYLVNNERAEVVLLWLYTHAEFQQRPPDADLHAALDALFIDGDPEP